MHWKYKARIMKCCAALPWGGAIYRQIQKVFGRLGARPMSRLPAQAEMAKWIQGCRNAEMPKCRKAGVAETDRNDRMIGTAHEASDDSFPDKKVVEGKRFFEVGTGHVPVAPIGWFLCGAGSVVTVDLHRRIEWGLTRQSLEWMAGNRDEVSGVYAEVVDERVFDERFAVLTRLQHDPVAFFREAGIEYLAPMDAAHTSLADVSVDCHFSITVLEHIPAPVIRDVFQEARRILKPDGVAIHFVDLSDHFQHQDPSISKINFLRFSEAEWQRIAGNEFAYCNRLRASDYVSLFQDRGFRILQEEAVVDEEAMAYLQRGTFPLHKDFLKYDPQDISSTSLKILTIGPAN